MTCLTGTRTQFDLQYPIMSPRHSNLCQVSYCKLYLKISQKHHLGPTGLLFTIYKDMVFSYFSNTTQIQCFIKPTREGRKESKGRIEIQDGGREEGKERETGKEKISGIKRGRWRIEESECRREE